MSERITEAEFQSKAEEAIRRLEQSFGELADDRDIDVEVQGGVLKVIFEEGEPGTFVVSPNSSVRQVWVSARVASYKFDWSDDQSDFVLAGTGEPIKQVLTRLTAEQLGDHSVSL